MHWPRNDGTAWDGIMSLPYLWMTTGSVVKASRMAVRIGATVRSRFSCFFSFFSDFFLSLARASRVSTLCSRFATPS